MVRPRARSVLSLLAAGFAAFALVVVAAGCGDGGTSTTAATIAPDVAAGGHAFVQFGCSQCHGEQGKGGVSHEVPELRSLSKTLTRASLRQIIDNGLGVVNNPASPYMPVWGPIISNQQVSDLVAYIGAGLPVVPYAVPIPVPTGQGDVVAGAALYQRYGCINCHGPNGLGGVPNPGSEDQVIPPLTGADFHGEFNTDAKILQMIRDGSVIGKPPIASMPRWGEIIPPEQLDQLVAFIKTLK